MTFDICSNIANVEHLLFHMVYFVYGLNTKANDLHNDQRVQESTCSKALLPDECTAGTPGLFS